eukprot:scaffold175444_cov50-Tisochrysis_lutea.AAC.4
MAGAGAPMCSRSSASGSVGKALAEVKTGATSTTIPHRQVVPRTSQAGCEQLVPATVGNALLSQRTRKSSPESARKRLRPAPGWTMLTKPVPSTCSCTSHRGQAPAHVTRVWAPWRCGRFHALPQSEPVPPMHASEPQPSRLSPTAYLLPFGQVHQPVYHPTPGAFVSTTSSPSAG